MDYIDLNEKSARSATLAPVTHVFSDLSFPGVPGLLSTSRLDHAGSYFRMLATTGGESPAGSILL